MLKNGKCNRWNVERVRQQRGDTVNKVLLLQACLLWQIWTARTLYVLDRRYLCCYGAWIRNVYHPAVWSGARWKEAFIWKGIDHWTCDVIYIQRLDSFLLSWCVRRLLVMFISCGFYANSSNSKAAFDTVDLRIQSRCVIYKCVYVILQLCLCLGHKRSHCLDSSPKKKIKK